MQENQEDSPEGNGPVNRSQHIIITGMGDTTARTADKKQKLPNRYKTAEVPNYGGSDSPNTLK